VRHLPENYGPRTTGYNRFVRWRRAGIWDQIVDALAAGHDAAVQMIDTSVVRVLQEPVSRTTIGRIWTLSRCRDPIRQTRGQLSGIHQARINPFNLISVGAR
jgi:transposase